MRARVCACVCVGEWEKRKKKKKEEEEEEEEGGERLCISGSSPRLSYTQNKSRTSPAGPVVTCALKTTRSASHSMFIRSASTASLSHLPLFSENVPDGDLVEARFGCCWPRLKDVKCEYMHPPNLLCRRCCSRASAAVPSNATAAPSSTLCITPRSITSKTARRLQDAFVLAMYFGHTYCLTEQSSRVPSRDEEHIRHT